MENENPAAETRVRFGDKDWQTMPLIMAELLLQELRRTQPKRWGDALAAVTTADVNGHRP